MRLKKLKLYSDYKSLKKETIFNFDENSEILALAGINGSGKTQILEVITKILSNATENKAFLDLKYYLEFELVNNIFKIIYNDNKFIMFQNNIFIDENISPNYYNNNWKIGTLYNYREENKYISQLINNRLNLITYSSAKTSVLSDFYYYEKINTITNYKNYYKENSISINNFKDSNKYINKRIRKIIILALFIFENEKTNEILGEYISNMKKIKNFNFNFLRPQFREAWEHSPLPLGHYDLFIKKYIYKNNISINDFIKTDYFLENDTYQMTTSEIDFNHININFKDINVKFWLNNLEFLETLNFLNYTQNELNQIRESKNISELVEENYSRKYFSINDIYFENDISLNHFADGEIQLLETLGMIILYENNEELKETLYIYDEPDTHLNTLWKSDYNYLLNKSLNSKEKNLKSQVLFSTHNQEILADIKKDSITLLKAGKPQIIKRETFGSSINIINNEIFDKKDSVSKSVLNEIKNYYEKIKTIDTIEAIEQLDKEIELFLGKSAEKIILQNELERKKIKLKSCRF